MKLVCSLQAARRAAHRRSTRQRDEEWSKKKTNFKCIIMLFVQIANFRNAIHSISSACAARVSALHCRHLRLILSLHQMSAVCIHFGAIFIAEKKKVAIGQILLHLPPILWLVLRPL